MHPTAFFNKKEICVRNPLIKKKRYFNAFRFNKKKSRKSVSAVDRRENKRKKKNLRPAKIRLLEDFITMYIYCICIWFNIIAFRLHGFFSYLIAYYMFTQYMHGKVHQMDFKRKSGSPNF